MRKSYSEALVGPKMDVVFEDEEIVLQVPKEGITVNYNWTITPLAYPKVQKATQFSVVYLRISAEISSRSNYTFLFAGSKKAG